MSKPINKSSTVNAVDDTRWNKTTGKFEDSLGNPVSPQEYLKKYKDDLVHESPLPVGMPREPKIHSPAYRRKYPERYKSGYVPWYDRDDKLKEKIKQTRMSDWDAIKSVATRPEDVKDITDIIRKAHKRDSKSITRDELKYLKSKDRNLDHKFIDTTAKPWIHPEPEPIPEPQFDSWKLPVEQDLEKGLGSFFKYPKAYAKK